MERNIGEIFEYNGEWYQCVEDDYPFNCTQCSFFNGGEKECSGYLTGYCKSEYRCDGKEVIFKKLEKVGEPYRKSGIMVQKYKVNIPIEMPDKPYMCFRLFDNTLEIEIKQNQENMEEKELNLKPFDLDKAKEGKPVCTRDGRKARIICYDMKADEYHIVALIDDGGEEIVCFFSENGLRDVDGESRWDLMMLPEKHDGWVNVYKGGLLDTKSYNTKKEAFDKASPRDYIDTVKISWEE